MGAYHRRILLDTRPPLVEGSSGGSVVAELEDDFHRFGVTLHHDGTVVTAVEGHADRTPWSTCEEAVGVLPDFAGMPLFTRHSEVGRWARPREHCTHLFDITGLAVVHAGRGRMGRRTYDIEVPDREGEATRPSVERDGELVFRWDVDGSVIRGPAPFAEVALRGAFLSWAEEHLDEEGAEAAMLLRRAIDTSIGRGMQDVLDAMDRPNPDSLVMMEGACYSFQRVNMRRARRNKGMARDFTSGDGRLLADVDVQGEVGS